MVVDIQYAQILKLLKLSHSLTHVWTDTHTFNMLLLLAISYK